MESPKSADSPKQQAPGVRAIEARKRIVCYNCYKEGHISVKCKQQKLAFACMLESEKNLKLLEPYVRDVVINGKKFRALQDSAATMDVAHPSCVSSTDYTGECAWIKQVAEE
ncbi:hypothetical protein V5799_000660 [Amblyomma americanum]|uniref:CCHC-type domain-containing protein n=1 Tax=Amblyomma americanum TaxID=6943 RepID=A0AAQ4D2E8_AMBAM